MKFSSSFTYDNFKKHMLKKHYSQAFTEEIYEHFDQITAVEPVYAIEAASGLWGYATSYDIGDEL